MALGVRVGLRVGALVGFAVFVGVTGVRVGRRVRVNSGVSVTDALMVSAVTVSVDGGPDVSGVGVSGARVGMGAWVGVASSVLPGRAKVGGTVGMTTVGRTTVGTEMMTVAGGGVATSVGRIIKLISPKP